jgi:Na+-driven multidrug efflux pump
VGGVIGRLGADALAGNNAATSFMQLSFMPAYGLSIGLTALVGRYIGRGDYRAAKRRAYLGMACACSYMTLMGVVFYIFRRPLIGLFRHEPAVIAAGSLILTYIPLFQFADAFGIVSAGALKGAGDTRFPAVAQIVFAWLFFLPLVFVLGNPRVGGLRGAWAAATIYIWVYDLVLLWRFVGERWRKINIFE